MIYSLTGIIREKVPPRLIVEVGGVGFLVFMPLSLFDKIGGPGDKLSILTRLIVKEDAMELYGFLTSAELCLFEDLITVPGIGPKSGLSLLSRFSVAELVEAIENQNDELLSTVSGIGKKTAAKIILELKGKIKFEKDKPSFNQAVEALISLGLTRGEAIERLKGVDPRLAAGEMIKKVLGK